MTIARFYCPICCAQVLEVVWMGIPDGEQEEECPDCKVKLLWVVTDHGSWMLEPISGKKDNGSDTFNEYESLSSRLISQRESGDKYLTEKEEDDLLDELDVLWYKLTEEEIEIIDKRAAKWVARFYGISLEQQEENYRKAMEHVEINGKSLRSSEASERG